MARSLPVEAPGLHWAKKYYHRIRGQLSTTCSKLLKQPMGNFQLQTPQTAGQWRQRQQIKLTGCTPYPHGQYPLSASCIELISAASAGNRPCNLQHARQPPCLCGHSGQIIMHQFCLTPVHQNSKKQHTKRQMKNKITEDIIWKRVKQARIKKVPKAIKAWVTIPERVEEFRHGCTAVFPITTLLISIKTFPAIHVIIASTKALV